MRKMHLCQFIDCKACNIGMLYTFNMFFTFLAADKGDSWSDDLKSRDIPRYFIRVDAKKICDRLC
jgi:hypothetical protein